MNRVPGDREAGAEFQSVTARVGEPAAAEQMQGRHVEGHCGSGVADQADRVIAPGVEPPGPVLGRKKYPAQGLIGTQVKRGPRPSELVPTQAPVEIVLEEVRFIVPVDEVVAEPRGKRGESQGDESQCHTG